MPYKKKRAPRMRRKRARGRRYARKARPFNPYQTIPLKTKHVATLRYFEPNFTIDPGAAGTAAAYVFSANGLYDPNITGTGHQPLGFDQLMAMYNHYVVIGASIRVTFWNEDSTYTQLVALSTQSGSTPTATMTNLIEQGRCKWTTVGVANSGNDRKTLSLKINPNKFMTRSSPLSDPNVKGDSTANPAEQAYFHVMAAPNNNSVNSSQIRCSATLEFRAVFFEPKFLSES